MNSIWLFVELVIGVDKLEQSNYPITKRPNRHLHPQDHAKDKLVTVELLEYCELPDCIDERSFISG